MAKQLWKFLIARFYVKNNAKKPTFMYAYSALFQEIS